MVRNAQTDRGVVLGITAALLALAVGHSTPAFATDCDPDLIDKVTAADGSTTDSFGLSAAVDGDTAVIGAVWDDDHGFNSGSAYVFVRSGGAWVQQAKLLAPDGAANDNFGRSAGISGDTIVIGAQNDDDHGTDSGSANIFVRTGNTWTWQAKLTASDGASLDRLGWQIDISGDTVVASSHRDDDHGTDSGSAYVFVRAPDGTWFQQAKLTASDAAPADEFGHAVAISGDTILIGAYKNDDAGSSSGAAYVFVRGGHDIWTEQAKLTASNANTGYHFARFLDLDGDTALIGSPFYWPLNYGSAYIFVRQGDEWTEQTMVTARVPRTQEWFGSAVAISGDTAVVGSFFINDDDPGTAHVFRNTNGTWLLDRVLRADDGAFGDAFGRHLALDGETALIAANHDNDNGLNSGSAYLFDLRCESSICPADLNGDGEVGITDFLDLLAAWGPNPGHPADFDDDGFVGITDFLALLAAWGPCP